MPKSFHVICSFKVPKKMPKTFHVICSFKVLKCTRDSLLCGKGFVLAFWWSILSIPNVDCKYLAFVWQFSNFLIFKTKSLLCRIIQNLYLDLNKFMRTIQPRRQLMIMKVVLLNLICICQNLQNKKLSCWIKILKIYQLFGSNLLKLPMYYNTRYRILAILDILSILDATFWLYLIFCASTILCILVPILDHIDVLWSCPWILIFNLYLYSKGKPFLNLSHVSCNSHMAFMNFQSWFQTFQIGCGENKQHR
jgi:hypothetical protein